MKRKREHGFTMIEILVVIAIIAIISAIGIANYLGALQRARQKRTMSDIRTVAMSWEARAGDAQAYTAAGFTCLPHAVTYGDLNLLLVPTYTRTMPPYDGWETPYEYSVGTTATNAQTYAIRSAGRDRRFEGGTYPGGGTNDLDCDIVFSAGAFVQYPETMQTQ